ncbi:MAG: ATP-binding protein [Planctomycetota bacterium]
MSTPEKVRRYGASTPRVREVVILAGSGEWLAAASDGSAPAELDWVERWMSDPPVKGTVDLFVAPPMLPVPVVRSLRETFPCTPILLVVQPDDGKSDAFLGDEEVFFVPPPTSVGLLRTCVREVLAFRSARDSSEAAGQDIPVVCATEPVSGWFELTGPTHPVFLRRFHAWMDLLRGAGIESDEFRRLAHAVREIGWNAIEWGNRFDLRRTLKLSFLRLDDRLLFRVEDEGRAGDWVSERGAGKTAVEDQRSRVRDGRGYGGFGLMLVQRIMDKIEVSSGGNIVVMEKHLPGMRPGGAG